MSEEAVRQTRSQKRVLEKDAAPHPIELSDADSESKKPKLDTSEATTQEQTELEPEPVLAQENLGRTMVGSEQEKSLSPLSLALPLASQPVEEDQERAQQTMVEPGSDNRTDCNDRASKVKTESAVDARSQVRPTEPKATIKVEVRKGEQPVDMSTSRGSIKREKRPPSPEDDDVIILSDNDSPSPPMNGLSHFKELDTDLLMKSSPVERERIIKQLKVELRLEEAKLVLLKKLRQSQIQKDALQKPSGLSGSSAPPPLIRGTITSNKGSQQILTGRSSGTVIPPPLVRGGQQVSSKHGSQIIMPPLVRGTQPISVSPQQIQALRQQQQLAASGGSGPPPLLMGPRTSAPASQGQRGMVHSGLIRIGSSANTLASASSLKGSSSGSGGVSVVSVNDSPASRQAAAKLALRKQLEKTLLEIPPPKPPAPEFNFLPSAANNEFIYLVGLEEVVQNLLDTIHRGKTGVALSKTITRDPFTCTQCKTDFTCRWRHDKTKGGTVLCEHCMSSNQKKVLKAEHTKRLKAAFVKALQQEQEIEQRLFQQTSSPVSHSSSSSSSSMKAEQLVSQHLKQAHARASSQHLHQASRGANMVHHHSVKQSSQGQLSHGVSSLGVRGVPHSFSSSSQLQSAVAAAALVSRPGKNAHGSVRSVQSSKVSSSGTAGGRNISGGSASSTAWKKQSNSNTGVTMAYVNPSLTGHKSSAGVDARQREYLLDMIPSRSSISQTANTWK
ncbi:transcriptional repressor p66 alpha-like isoform X1 [Etheostoma cragini]|uniref:transcriptional repressor p66 alpha-like isoform X1 n=1 Tax=Etheostoma cragini TaxID=417921 RepID=UPI00155E9106|nr:transcriptional repressor p66 alpha-like isoform X1 [Etheostoma cragini]XP_034744524.1 transcriptional repressor p66 alpha-like isoform X1 [Etheostoma cragini]XP_034744525.1 transcriptional repressor p66 alpha-like isoform X1 [Etheostoma cragini]XP_034744526.1 transcriptional repressor p66 alpha-like isoform X1 [Etheostoma cragini]XP_034744527.1 transcriptional repressor p66 alpha-like isoform X1 [Etheostoma cragini]XP_034744528.1 transcriptional repressor p66 alpha-like isoform X1 [Etheost